MPDPRPYFVYRLPDGLHVRTMSPARMIQGKGADRICRVFPVDGVPSIEGEAWIPCSDLIEVATDEQWKGTH